MLLDCVGCSLLIQTNKVDQLLTDMEWQTGPNVGIIKVPYFKMRAMTNRTPYALDITLAKIHTSTIVHNIRTTYCLSYVQLIYQMYDYLSKPSQW